MPPEVIVTVLAVVAGLAATTSPTVWLRRWGWVLAVLGLALAVVAVGPAALTGAGHPRCSSNPGSCAAATTGPVATTSTATTPGGMSAGAGSGGRGHPAGGRAGGESAWQAEEHCIDDGDGPMRLNC